MQLMLFNNQSWNNREIFPNLGRQHSHNKSWANPKRDHFLFLFRATERWLVHEGLIVNAFNALLPLQGKGVFCPAMACYQRGQMKYWIKCTRSCRMGFQFSGSTAQNQNFTISSLKGLFLFTINVLQPKSKIIQFYPFFNNTVQF